MSTNFPWDRGSSAGRGKSKYTLKGNRVNLDSVPNGIPTKKVLELINEFSKVAGYKSNIQNQLHFHTQTINNPKIKLIKIISFTTAQKNFRNKLN